jgi:UPF0176 protein
MSSNKYLVAALYKFVSLPDYKELQPKVQKICDDHSIMGTILLAKEGINGTVAGFEDDMRAMLEELKSEPRLHDLEHKESYAKEPPFYRMKVRLKKEIVTLGVDAVDPTCEVGTYVNPQDWNALISDPDVILVDTRNDYEVSIGTFKGAVNPETTAFREFPEWVENELSTRKDAKVAMFCTGGIRCEKSTSLLKHMGFDDVYHLKGGILKYLEEVPEKESLWEGECFVFDQRVSVGHGLKPGPYDLCHACRHPISEDDKQSEFYIHGVSCPRCHDEHSDEQKKRFADRQKQIELAKARNEKHIAADIEKAKEEKRRQLEEHRAKSNARSVTQD